MMILAPSVLAADFADLRKEIKAVEEAGVTYLHFDVMDGLFVPSISFGMPVLESVKKITDLKLDVHLMIQNPERYVEEFIRLGADIITFHVEACSKIDETIRLIHQSDCKVGLAISPNTPYEVLKPYLEKIDLALIMTVEPGFGGQFYLPSSTEKITQVRRAIEEIGKDILLEVDGGISSKNVDVVVKAGANMIVAGSAVFGTDTRRKAVEFIQKLEELEKEKNR